MGGTWFGRVSARNPSDRGAKFATRGRSDRRIELGDGLLLLAPGLRGQAVWHGTRELTLTRAETQESAQLQEGLQEAGLEDRHTVELRAETPPVPAGYERTLATEVAPNEVELEVPVTGQEEVQFAIYIDEDGRGQLALPRKRTAGTSLDAKGGEHGGTSVSDYAAGAGWASGKRSPKPVGWRAGQEDH
jgi:hypothetical protein